MNCVEVDEVGVNNLPARKRDGRLNQSITQDINGKVTYNNMGM